MGGCHLLGSQALLVLTTCATPTEADELAKVLVEKRLAACVNRLEVVVSTYRWRSKLEQDQETLLLIKTTEECFDGLENAIRKRSSYELPELIAVPICKGTSTYLDWLKTSVADEN